MHLDPLIIAISNDHSVAFRKRKCENNQGSVTNESSHYQLAQSSYRCQVLIFYPLLTDNRKPRLASENGSDTLTVFTLFSFFFFWCSLRFPRRSRYFLIKRYTEWGSFTLVGCLLSFSCTIEICAR